MNSFPIWPSVLRNHGCGIARSGPVLSMTWGKPLLVFRRNYGQEEDPGGGGMKCSLWHSWSGCFPKTVITTGLGLLPASPRITATYVTSLLHILLLMIPKTIPSLL